MFQAEKDHFFSIAKARERFEALKAKGYEIKYVEVPRKHGGYRDRETCELLFDLVRRAHAGRQAGEEGGGGFPKDGKAEEERVGGPKTLGSFRKT